MEQSWNSILIEKEACGNFNLKCGMIWFTSFKEHLVYFMEKGIVELRLAKKKKKEEGRRPFILELHYCEKQNNGFSKQQIYVQNSEH